KPPIGRDGSRNAAPLQRGTFIPEEGDFGLVSCAGAGRGNAITAERFNFVEVRGVGFLGHLIWRSWPELCGILQHEGGDLFPLFKDDEPSAPARRALARNCSAACRDSE